MTQPPTPQPAPGPQYGPPGLQPGAHQLGPQQIQPPPKRPKRFGILALGVAALTGLVLGSCGGALTAGGDAAITATPAATVTAPGPTVTAPGPTVTFTPPPAVEGGSEPTEEPATEEPAAAYQPKPGDFKIAIKVRDKQCFGSAGCNVTYQIDPEYVGDQPLPDGEIEVTYEVTGAEDDIVNLFTISDGQASFDKDESTQTSSSSVKLKAKATDVSVS